MSNSDPQRSDTVGTPLRELRQARETSTVHFALDRMTSHSATSYSSPSTARAFRTPVSASLTPTAASSRSWRSSRDATSREGSSDAGSRTGGHHQTQQSPTTAPGGRTGALSDPHTTIFTFIMHSKTGRVAVNDISTFLDWDSAYRDVFGDLLEFLQSYQSLFYVSPVDDTVTLQREAVVSHDSSRLLPSSSRTRRRIGGTEPSSLLTAPRQPRVSDDGDTSSGAEDDSRSFSTTIGSVSYSCVAESFDLAALSRHYESHSGFAAALEHDVLHIAHRVDNTSLLPAAEALTDDSFDLFLFPTGSVVWWGIHRPAHRGTERDYLSSHHHLVNGVHGRYPQDIIDELCPAWCTYEVEPSSHAQLMEIPVRLVECGDQDRDKHQCARTPGAAPRDEDLDAALVRFSRRLRYDHYILPENPTYRAQVMLTVSHCLARCARMDYYEHITRATHRSVLAIPGDFHSVLEYFSTRRAVDRLSGELLVAQLAIKTLKDSPDFLWEMPWLQPFYDLTDAQYASKQRLAWFSARSDALLAQLASVKGRHFRLFMLGSDVFLIVLLLLDVLFMTSRLVVKLYFRLPEEED